MARADLERFVRRKVVGVEAHAARPEEEPRTHGKPERVDDEAPVRRHALRHPLERDPGRHPAVGAREEALRATSTRQRVNSGRWSSTGPTRSIAPEWGTTVSIATSVLIAGPHGPVRPVCRLPSSRRARSAVPPASLT